MIYIMDDIIYDIIFRPISTLANKKYWKYSPPTLHNLVIYL